MSHSDRTKIKTIGEGHIGQILLIKGWIYEIRPQKRLIFVKLADDAESRVRPLQIVFAITKENAEYFESLAKSTVGTCISCTGQIVESGAKADEHGVKEQLIEMSGSEFTIIGRISDPITFPIAKTDLTMEYIRKHETHECLTQVKSIIYMMKAKLLEITDGFFIKEDFKQIITPLITFSQCEGGCQPFRVTTIMPTDQLSDVSLRARPKTDKDREQESFVESLKQTYEEQGDVPDQIMQLWQQLVQSQKSIIDYSQELLGGEAFLTVSSQLELELATFLGAVYTWTRACRAEPSRSTRHMAEFTMLEIEIPFTDSAVDVMNITERYVKYCFKYILDHYSKELGILESKFKTVLVKKLQAYVEKDFVRMKHADAIAAMLSSGHQFVKEPSFTDDLNSEHEQWLCVTFGPIFVIHFPEDVKAFYMPGVEEDEATSRGVKHVDCFDLLIDGIELVGGSQRIHDYDELMGRIRKLGLDPKPLKFYTDKRKDGSCPTGGMGLGFERLIKILTGVESVRDCVAFAKYPDCIRK
jgi:asparaginyl-tRNA synthetase